MDKFATFPTTPISPAREAVAVSPDDSAELTQVSRAVYVGQPGDLSVNMADGTAVTFEGVQGGSLLPIRVTGVNATGTTAGGILALW